MDEKQQQQLVLAAMSGDLDSFGALAGHQYRAMVATAYVVLRDHHAAEDAVQEAYRKALVKLPSLTHAGRFGSWLRTICRNTALDMLKSGIRRRNLVDQYEVEPWTEAGKSSHKPVRDAIDALPGAFRELIMLRYYSSMSLERIAAVVGLSPAAVNGRLSRARKKIAQHLRRSGFSE